MGLVINNKMKIRMDRMTSSVRSQCEDTGNRTPGYCDIRNDGLFFPIAVMSENHVIIIKLNQIE